MAELLYRASNVHVGDRIGYSRPDMAKVRPSRLFLQPLSIKYTIFTHIYLRKIWLFKPEYDILMTILGTYWDFHKSAEKYSK